MALDTRFWSVFIFVTTSALLLASISTPYYVKGVIVTFGEQGLWRVDSDAAGDRYYTITQVLLLLAVVFDSLTLVGYIMLFYRITWPAQIIAFVAQLLTGVLAAAAVAVFAVNDRQMAEGWWMATMASVLFFVNSLVILFMPMMDFDQSMQQILLSNA